MSEGKLKRVRDEGSMKNHVGVAMARQDHGCRGWKLVTEMGRSIGNGLGHNAQEFGFWPCTQERFLRRTRDQKQLHRHRAQGRVLTKSQE